MPAYYNEIDPVAAQWLRNLIDAGHIAPGVVDERSIEDVTPADLVEFNQCHFFAGIGVWSYALRRAGISDDTRVWTGSCPCQPFSEAGEGAGFADERHLWPAFGYLIEQQKPPIVFGEQVASKSAMSWLDLVQADMEAVDYAFGAVPFPAASIGAPHIRDRLYWVGLSGIALGDAIRTRLEGLAGYGDHSYEPGRLDAHAAGSIAATSGFSGVANADGGNASTEREQRSGEHGQLAQDAGLGHGDQRPGPVNGFWRAADWLRCRDERWRPVEPGTSPLAHGAPARVGRLRAYGNAICAEQARVFIEATLAA